MKRYLILVQHEVIVYGEDEQAAQRSLLNNKFMKERTNPKCVFVQELPMPDQEKNVVFEDWRKAPGA
jgi:hypothetical protein